MSSVCKRGALIVFEGCDRSGKTTTCQRLVKQLTNNITAAGTAVEDTVPAAKFMRFPDRSTKIGSVIDEYLQGKNQLDDHVIHLLFSTNRWEKSAELIKTLESGTHVIVDRYAFSGVAFSAAKDGLSLEWCKQPDRGLPRPDLVCFLDVSSEEAAKRGGYGAERYENKEFQNKVRINYDRLMQGDPTWKTVDTDGLSLDQVFEQVKTLCLDVINKTDREPIQQLWPME